MVVQCGILVQHVCPRRSFKLHIVFMNDFSRASNILFSILFADDTTVIIEGQNYNNLILTLNTELDKLDVWLQVNKLTLNTDKTHYMVFHTARIKSKTGKISIRNNAIDEVKSTKFLDVIIDDKLKWTEHIQYIKNKISKSIGILIKIRPYLDKVTLRNLYFTFVYPYLMINMDVSRISKTIFIWGMKQSSAKCRSHFHRVHQFLISVDMEYVYRAQDANSRSILCSFGHELSQLQLTQWTEKLNAPVAVRGEMFGGNKLRTYRTFKNEFITEPYLSIIVHKKYRSAYAKFRCGVAPLKIETGRYGVNRVPVEERLCETCNSVEDEFHVLMKCPLYRDARDFCFNSISAVSEVFADLPQESQFIELMSNPLHYKIISKFMYTILNQRRYLLYL